MIVVMAARLCGWDEVPPMAGRAWPKVVQDALCHAHRPIVAQTAVNDPVTERGNRLSSQQFGPYRRGLAHGGVMVKAFGREGALLDDFGPLGSATFRRGATPIPPI